MRAGEEEPFVIKVVPSLASANQLDLRSELDKVSVSPTLHLDIEDGNFVDNITFGLHTIRDICRHWDGSFNAHLMVTNPMKWIQPLASLKTDRIAVHIEALPYPSECIAHMELCGVLPGLALNPVSPLEPVLYYATRIRFYLVMTAEPDGAGQKFQPAMLEKIRFLRSRVSPDCEIWADGGIGEAELSALEEAGCDVAVMGRVIFSGSDVPEFCIRRFLN